MALLSAGASVLSRAAVRFDHAIKEKQVKHTTNAPIPYTSAASYVATPNTLPSQTVSLGQTLTNFANEPLSPVLNLFNPSLGTLLSVSVSHTATIQSNIVSQNRSTSSGTTITASLTGSYELTGLNQPISKPSTTVSSLPMNAGIAGSATDTVTFPTLVIPDSGSATFTDPASLAFFTSSSAGSTVTVNMTATATAAAAAPNGNLLTTTSTSADSSVTVTYTYLPVCPTLTGVGRIGVHQQQTQIVVTFSGPVDTSKADDPDNYDVINRGGKSIPIKSATFDPVTNAVTLVPVRSLNVHYHFDLSVVIPCANEQTPQTVVVPFGGKRSLLGFHNHRGEFVTVQHGEVVGYYNKSGTFIKVHPRKL
jgi:hypothetical protein